MIELNVIDIDGKQYFEIEYIKGKTNTYYYYGNEENPEDFKIFKGVIKDDQELFFLKVDGESMNNIVDNGSYVLIRKQEYAENGDIIVALVNNDDEATLKRYKIIDKQFKEI